MKVPRYKLYANGFPIRHEGNDLERLKGVAKLHACLFNQRYTIIDQLLGGVVFELDGLQASRDADK